MSHSPLPWKHLSDSMSDYVLLDANGKQIIAGCGCCGSPWINSEEDAALITAAPKLLKALKLMLAFPNTSEAISQANEAISDAEQLSKE